MALEELFIEAVEKLEKQTGNTVFQGIVEKVNNDSCELSREGLPNLIEVRLDSVIGITDNYIRVTPKLGSEVTCLKIEGSIEEISIVKYSEIDNVRIKIGGVDFKTTKDGVIMNGGNNGGVAITPELTKQLAVLTGRVDGIIKAIERATPTLNDGGLGLQMTMKANLDLLIEKEDFSKIENNKVKH